MNEFNWERAFFNLNTNEKVSLFLIQLLKTYWRTLFRMRQSSVMIQIPHGLTIYKKKLYKRNSLYKIYHINNDTWIFQKLRLLQKKLHLEESRDTYYSYLSTKFVKQKSNPKICWSVLKRFLNDKKRPWTPSLFHENKLVTDFRKKADIFNSFFAKECSLINSDSSLPSKIKKKTGNCLYSVKYSTKDILQIIKT